MFHFFPVDTKKSIYSVSVFSSSISSFFGRWSNFFLALHSLDDSSDFRFLRSLSICLCCSSIFLTRLGRMVHSKSHIGCFVGSLSSEYSGISTPNRFKTFTIMVSTYDEITKSAFLSYFVGCKLQITNFPPCLLFFDGSAPLGFICNVVPRVMFRSAKLQVNNSNQHIQNRSNIFEMCTYHEWLSAISRSLSGKSCSQSKILSTKYPPRQARAPLPPLQIPPVRFWPTVGVGIFRTYCLSVHKKPNYFQYFLSVLLLFFREKLTFGIYRNFRQTYFHVVQPNVVAVLPIVNVNRQYSDLQCTLCGLNQAMLSMPYDIWLELLLKMRHSLVVLFLVFLESKHLLVLCIN